MITENPQGCGVDGRLQMLLLLIVPEIAFRIIVLIFGVLCRFKFIQCRIYMPSFSVNTDSTVSLVVSRV
jgi:hypothetical protein